MQIELLHQPCAMGFDRIYAEFEEIRDVFARVPFCYQLQDLPLAG